MRFTCLFFSAPFVCSSGPCSETRVSLHSHISAISRNSTFSIQRLSWTKFVMFHGLGKHKYIQIYNGIMMTLPTPWGTRLILTMSIATRPCSYLFTTFLWYGFPRLLWCSSFLYLSDLFVAVCLLGVSWYFLPCFLRFYFVTIVGFACSGVSCGVPRSAVIIHLDMDALMQCCWCSVAFERGGCLY